jgi:hypothetical protein
MEFLVLSGAEVAPPTNERQTEMLNRNPIQWYVVG